MKYISTILALYIFALAVLPCADQAEWCVSDVRTEAALDVAHTNGHDHGSENADHCSPLCICNCCHIPLRTPFKTGLSIATPRATAFQVPSLYQILIDLAATRDIWQPPRLG